MIQNQTSPDFRVPEVGIPARVRESKFLMTGQAPHLSGPKRYSSLFTFIKLIDSFKCLLNGCVMIWCMEVK